MKDRENEQGGTEVEVVAGTGMKEEGEDVGKGGGWRMGLPAFKPIHFRQFR